MLAADPGDATIHNWLGAACLGLGKANEAAAHLAEAVRLDPALALAHENIGKLLVTQNRFAEAAASLRSAATLEPRNAALRLKWAQALVEAGQADEAHDVLQQAVRLAPDNVAVRTEMARALAQRGRWEESLPHFRHVTVLVPDQASAHAELGSCLATLGQTTQAIAAYQAAIKLKPNDAERCAVLAKLYLDENLLEESVRWSERSIQLCPDVAKKYVNLGSALSKLKKYDAARQAFEQAIRLNPKISEAYSNLGVVSAAEGQFEAAIGQYQQALAVWPANSAALCNLGNLSMRRGDMDAALAYYDRALDVSPDYGEAHHNRAVARLLLGQFDRGLPEFEWRLKLREYPGAPTQWPLWNSEPLAGRTIVLWHEGGLGDMLQFIRYARVLKARGARVIATCDPVLLPILSRTEGVDEWKTSTAEHFAADYCVPLLSVPQRVGTTLATIPAPVPYVFADERLVDRWRDWLAAYPGFKVGIVWQGNPQFVFDNYRSIPLANFATLAEVRGARFVNLQQGVGREQLREFSGLWSVIEPGDTVDRSAGAFMDTAAIMRNLDLVITSDTSAAHLAGALGIKVWLAVHRAPDWRWLLDREDSPWYPTMRIFRQTELGDWPGVFAKLAVALDQAVKNGGK